jgi:hypothetical protein
MPGFNLKGLSASLDDQRISNFKKTYGGLGSGDFKYKPIYWSALSDGAYKVRLAPKHPSKCPQGFVRLATHRIEHRVGEKWAEIICTYKPGVEGAECYVCDIMEAVQDELSTFSKDVQAALMQMNPRQLFLFPSLITAKPDPKFVPTDARKYAPWVPDDQARQGAILQLEGKRVLAALFDVLKEYPDANDVDEGYWLQITKMGKETPIVRAARAASELTPSEAELMSDKDYPVLHPIPKFMSKSLRELDYNGQKSFIAGCWWASEVIADENEAADMEDIDL